MTDFTTTTAPQPARLLDSSCGHRHRHGREFYDAGLCDEHRGTRLTVMSMRHGRIAGPAFVSLVMTGGAFLATFRLSSDDAETVARQLLDAAAMAREVTALVEAGACK